MTGIGNTDRNTDNSNNRKRTAQAAFGGKPLSSQPRTLPTQAQALQNTLPIQADTNTNERDTLPENQDELEAFMDSLLCSSEIGRALSPQPLIFPTQAQALQNTLPVQADTNTNETETEPKSTNAITDFGNLLPAGIPLPPPPTLLTREQTLQNILPNHVDLQESLPNLAPLPNQSDLNKDATETAPENHAGLDAFMERFLLLQQRDQELTKRFKTPK